jgi:anti-anti-sigma factor
MEVCEALSDALESACRGERRWLLIDMSEMDFICSLGLGALVTAYVRMTKHEGRFGVIGPAAKIRQLLDITRLGDIFPSFDSRESALSGKA